MTGESEPVDKTVARVPPEAPLAERRSVLYAGTVVAAGFRAGVTVATGADTVFGSAALGAREVCGRPRARCWCRR